MKGSDALTARAARVINPSPVIQQEAHDVHMPIVAGLVQGCPATVVPRVQRVALSYEVLDTTQTALDASAVQQSLPNVIASVPLVHPRRAQTALQLLILLQPLGPALGIALAL